MQGASRILDGQWPYARLRLALRPGPARRGRRAVVAVRARRWRGGGVLRVAADATAAVAVWALVRPAAGRPLGARGLARRRRHRRPAHERQPVPGRARVRAVRRARRRRAGGRWPRALLAALAAFWRPDIGAGRGGSPRRVAGRCARGAAARRAAPPRAAAGAAAARGASLGGVALYAPFAAAAGVRAAAGTSSSGSRRATASCGGCRSRSPTTGRCAAGRRRRWPRTSRTCSGFYLPLIGLVLGALVLVLASCGAGRRPSSPACSCSPRAASLYLLSRPDELHAQPLIVCLCAAIPLRDRSPRAGGRRAARPGAPPALRAALAAGLALIVLAGRGQPAVGAAAAARPRAGAPRRRAGDPRAAGRGARRCRAMVARVQGLVPPGEPIYVAPRRSDLVTISDPLIHFLVRRPNVLSPRRQRAGAARASRRGSSPRCGAPARRPSCAGPTRRPRARSRTAAGARAARARSTSTSPPRTGSTPATAPTTCSCGGRAG